MNCEAFESLVTDLVRERPGQGSMGETALEHARSCDSCAARLADERALSELLAQAAAAPCTATPRVETALLAAFRARRAKLPVETARKWRPRVLPAVAWGIAAVLVLGLLGVASLKLIHVPTGGRSSQAGPAKRVFSPAGPAQIGNRAAGTEAAPENHTGGQASGTQSATRRVEPGHAAHQKDAPPVEIATDFIPLTPYAELSAVESGQLVRVLLPRSAMADCGLPVNQERADQPVTAQVLIGQDGVARAIRFLSQTNSNIVQTGLPSKR